MCNMGRLPFLEGDNRYTKSPFLPSIFEQTSDCPKCYKKTDTEHNFLAV